MLSQNQTELQLTSIWEQVLGVRPIGRDQDYFALGGNSLLAVFLFARVEERFGVALPLSTLIEARTIADMARILTGNEVSTDWTSLVELQHGQSRPPFFCVHGAGGNVLIYRDLTRHLGPDQPVYGLQSQGLDGKKPVLTSIEDMASLYVSEIQRIQPHGPYLLGGYCMGGTIALEMAQQLTTQGEEVALLALFDTLNWSKLPADSFWSKAYHQGQRILFHVNNFFLLNLTDQVRFFREKLKVLRSRSHVWRGMLLQSDRENGSRASTLARVWEANDSAILSYVPRLYPGVITDFRPVRQYARYADESLKCTRLALRGKKVVTLPVYPAGMLLEPFVKYLAFALRMSIDSAIGTGRVLSSEAKVGQV
jgi:phthiocerol/phenolphthiocerol synthesis type-I polyketide synthase E